MKRMTLQVEDSQAELLTSFLSTLDYVEIESVSELITPEKRKATLQSIPPTHWGGKFDHLLKDLRAYSYEE
jgi:hypothetical protein